MLSFTKFLIESEDRIAFHLNKYPEHKDFLDSFLSKNRHTRSKYLDWVTRSIQNTPLTNPEQLGKAVDFYHQGKQKQGVIPQEKKDINKFKSHDDFINTVKNIQNEQPISDKETKYDHPDNNIPYNNKGLKITNIGSHEAAKQVRTCYGGSLCTTMDEPENYNSYDKGSLHLYEFRNPDTGKIERYHSGLKNYELEFADLNNKHYKLNKLHPKLQELLYHNGPKNIKDNYEIAPPEEKKKIDEQKIMSNDPNKHGELLNKYGKNINPLVHKNFIENASVNNTKQFIELMGDKLYPDAQDTAMYHKDPSVAHKVIDTMGDKLHPDAQDTAMRHKDPSVAHKVIDTMGDKLHPYAQDTAMYHKDPSVAHKVIDTMEIGRAHV